jgi:hypothetical protein
MHVRPVAPGEVMVNHPAECIELIDEALRDRRATSWQKTELRQMQARAERELAQMGPLCDEIIAQLEDAGLIVTRAPGVFQSEVRRANFMNGVPGTTDDGVAYYITTGSTIAPLQRAFGRFIRKIGVNKVHFIANAGGSRSKLSAGELSLEMDGAFDCREVDHGGRSAVTDDALRDVFG